MKRLVLLALMLMCLAFPGLAEDVCVADASATTGLSCPQSYLRLTCPMEGEGQVMVSVADASGNLLYQRDYGLCSGSFRSEDIYLRLEGSQTRYQVTLQAGEAVYSFPVTRVMGRLKGNEACSAGYPLSRMAGGSTWRTATIIDTAALRGSGMTVPLYASGTYTLGSVTLSVSGDSLTVRAEISGGIDGSIDGAKVYVATDALSARQLGTRGFAGPTGRLGEAIPLSGTPYAAVLVQLTVSFDPSGVPEGPAIPLEGQDRLWQRMQEYTPSEAVG